MRTATRFMVVTVTVAIGVTLLGACGGGGDGGANLATVSGRVLRVTDGGGVQTAVVRLDNATAVTDADGEYTFRRVTPGECTLSVEREGYVQPGGTISVDIAAGDNRLDPVVLVADSDVPPNQPPNL